MTPTLHVYDDGGQVAGWRYLWLKYVKGFHSSRHCAGCLVGSYSRHVTREGMRLGEPLPLDEAQDYRHLYLCGVASRGGWAQNLHLVAEPCPGAEAQVQASTGTWFIIRHARRLEIPALPLGFGNKPKSFTTCRNWQFGIAYYGQNATPGASDLLCQPIDHPAK